MDFDLVAAPLLALLLGYALGSIPFGILLTRIAGAGDLRAIGSGNIGATNVLRTGRKGLAALTLLLDMAKAVVAILVARALIHSDPGLPALGALLGHLFPIWLRFKGGKGVATLFGIVLGYALIGELSWVAPAAYAAIWGGTLALSRYSSVAGVTAALLLPVVAAALGRFDIALLYLGMSLLVFWMHRGNLERLLAGDEPKVGSADG